MDFQRILPWVFISGLFFSILSYAANRYHGRERNIKELAQDFLGGSIFIGLLSAVVPDIFPDISKKLNISALNLGSATKVLGDGLSAAKSIASIGGASKMDDLELQVGPLPGI
ncbi:MAG: hypothetical protein EBT86_01315 [Actinobacteria bacterium]|nr:hypothetical protein [Actinomycetota bacterium]